MNHKLSIRGIVFMISAVLSLFTAILPASESVSLWDGQVPGASGTEATDVSVITPHIPAPEKATGAAIVVCPGGGYGHLAMGHEGEQIGQWLKSIGVAAFVLRYRLPSDGYRHPIPLMDAQRAIRMVRFNAKQWNIEPGRIGIMGFSAGGHLASSAGTHFSEPVVLDGYEADKIDGVDCRPDFMVLIYPVISMDQAMTHMGSRNNLLGENADAELVELMSNEKQVTAKTPPTFLVHASDDGAVVPENSIRFYQALLKADVPAEMHMYLKGGHGFGMRPSSGRAAEWPVLCEGWMRQMTFLSAD